MSYEKVRQAKDRIVIGSKQTKKAIERREVAEVYMAEDADPNMIHSLISLCKQYGVSLQRVPSMKQLGEACGIEVATITVALLKNKG